MDIEFYGANCISFTNKQVRLVVDDNLTELGAKAVIKDGDVAIFTDGHGTPAATAKLLIDSPGEYEVAGISITGIPARSHLEAKAVKSATMYKFLFEDTRVLVTGHIYPELTESQLEAIGTVDLMIVPTGGNGYTLDPTGAVQIMKKVEPKAVILTHYADGSLNFEVPQQSLEDAIKIVSLEPAKVTKKLKVKSGDFAESVMDLIVLEKA
jgi:L-ascorbate metabolism protein UlaG (beta-lactamase superfamily)